MNFKRKPDDVISGKRFHLTFKQLITLVITIGIVSFFIFNLRCSSNLTWFQFNIEPAKVDSSHVKINK